MPTYNKMVKHLRKLCNNRSELSGHKPDWQSGYQIEPHHINGRRGQELINPFSVIMLTRNEHEVEQGRVIGNGFSKETLLLIVKDIRLCQGFVEGKLYGEE